MKKKIRPIFKIKIMKRLHAFCGGWDLSHRRSILYFYRSDFPSSAFNVKAGVKYTSASAPAEFRKRAGYRVLLPNICDFRCSLFVMELDLACSTRAHPSAAWSNFCCVAFRQQKRDTFLSLKRLLVLCELIKKSRLFLSF